MGAYANIKGVFQNKNTKTKMVKTKSKKHRRHIFLSSKQGLLALALVFTLSFSVAGISLVNAATLQQQIDALDAENDKKQAEKNVLTNEATSLQDAINKLQGEINAKQATINQHTAEIEHLKVEIAKAEKELEQQRKVLGETIKTMYLDGDISTIEMLATSKDLSDFFDKQQYRESVRSKVKNTVDKITQLKLDLNTNKDKTEKLLAEQQNLKNELLAQRSEKDRILAMNQQDRDSLDRKMRENSSKIADLQRQQRIANARFSSGSVNVPDTTGYPWANYRAGSWTHAGSCYYGDDIDPWGMCYRQCVSYAAWKVWKTHGYMPYWGGRGNANLWDDNARAAGIPVNNTPARGAIAVSNSGTWGHVMFVESVNSNGTINISQYNVGLDGKYSERYNLSTAGLVFIHF